MIARTAAPLSLLALVLARASMAAQQPPAVRSLGPVVQVSKELMASVATALPMPGGHVLVNDITGHRVLLFDSTLSAPLVVADTTSATANAYGARAGTLIRFRGDTALFIDPSSLSMLVITPAGRIARVMAIPRPDDAPFLIGHVFGTPGFDAKGRLLYFSPAGLVGTFVLRSGSRGAPGRSSPPSAQPDSAFIVRVDLESRTIDTAAAFKVPQTKTSINSDAQGAVQSIETTRSPIPVIDDWAVCRDGSLAVVRGRDYHVDWLGADARWVSTGKIPFDWQRLTDERKAALIDSAVKADQAEVDSMSAVAGTAGTTQGGGARGAGGGTRGGAGRVAAVVGRPAITELPDYVPPFRPAALHCDANNNLWIRTTTTAKGQPVYDVINRAGKLVDRVQLPPFRTIAGFGSDVIYMAVLDNARIAHLERARVRQ